jgi:hypothetical protein
VYSYPYTDGSTYVYVYVYAYEYEYVYGKVEEAGMYRQLDPDRLVETVERGGSMSSSWQIVNLAMDRASALPASPDYQSEPQMNTDEHR